MPIYEYICNSCRKNKEFLQKFNDARPVKCHFCGEKNTLIKIISKTSFHLKGGGWYKDLYSSVLKSDKNIKSK